MTLRAGVVPQATAIRDLTTDRRSLSARRDARLDVAAQHIGRGGTLAQVAHQAPPRNDADIVSRASDGVIP